MNYGLKPYPAYQDSSVPWLGEIPAHWETERAKWLFHKMKRPVRPDDDVVTCFRDGTVTLRKNRRVLGFTNALKEIGYQGVRKGDLVIHAMDAFAGAVGVSDSDGKCTPVYAICQPQADSSPHYYAGVVREMARRQWIAALAKGVRERSTDFRFDGFAAQVVPVPPADEQAAIACFLDYVDRRIRRYIRAKRKLIALLEEQKQALIQRAVTRGLDPNVRLKPSGLDWLGQIPEHWEIVRIKYLLQEVNDRSTTGQETLLSLRMNHGLVPHDEHFARPGQASSLVGYKLVRPGQVVLNKLQANNGLVFASEIFGVVSPDYAVFNPATDVDLHYLTALFRTPVMKHEFRVESKGLGTGTAGFLRLYTDRFGAIPVSLPPRDEQSQIMRELDGLLKDLQDAVVHTQRQIDLIREYRTRLIADVVTGKLDVRHAVARLPAELEGVEGWEVDEAEEGDDEDLDEADAEANDEDD